MSDTKEDDKQVAVEMIMKEFEKKGVAVTSTTDGHTFVFSRGFLQKLLDSQPDQQKFLIMVKRPETN